MILEKKKGLSLSQKQGLTGFGFSSIWIVGFLIFTVYPIFYSLYLSFFNVSITNSGLKLEAIKWGNYVTAFTTDPTFTTDLSNYFSTMIVYVPVILVFSLILAMLLCSKLKGTGVFRTIFFLPVIITSGPVIQKIMDLGLTSFTNIEKLFDIQLIYDFLPQVLAKSVDYLVNSFILILWFSGVQILIFIAGIQKIDKSMYEAARIDGAGRWELFWKITFPVLNPIVILNVVYTVVMQSLFSLSPIVKKIGAEMSKELGYGFSSALSWIYMIVILLVLAVFVLLFIRRDKKAKIPQF